MVAAHKNLAKRALAMFLSCSLACAPLSMHAFAQDMVEEDLALVQEESINAAQEEEDLTEEEAVENELPVQEEEESQALRPQISLEGEEFFTAGASYSFTVTSDMNGILSVVLAETSQMPVEGQAITADEPFTVTVDVMPDEAQLNFIVTVRPENDNFENLEQLAVAGSETLLVTRDDEAESLPLAALARTVSTDWTKLSLGGASGSITVDDSGISFAGIDGKIASGENMGLFYYQSIENCDVNFRISADIEIQSLTGSLTASISPQSVAGFMLTGTLENTKANPGTVFAGYNYVSATTATPMLTRINGSSLSKISNGDLIAGEGSVLNVELVKIGETYFCYIDNSLAYEVSGSYFTGDAELYVGLFVCRSVDAKFTNLEYEILDDSTTVKKFSLSGTTCFSFLQNTEPQLNGIVVEVEFKDGNSRELAADEYTVTNLSTASVNTDISGQVHYRGTNATFSYNVSSDYAESISISVPPLYTSYAIGEEFDATGLAVQAHMASGDVVDLSSDSYELDIPLMDTAGIKKITVTYENCETYFDIEVKDITVSNVVVTEPRKTVYYLSDTAPTEKELLTGSTVTVIYSNGSKKLLSYGDYITDYDSTSFLSSERTVTVTITYLGVESTLKFEVYDLKLVSLKLKDYPQTTYNEGEALYLDDMTVVGVYNDGSVTGNTLTADSDYKLNTENVDMDAAGLYTIKIIGLDTYATLSGSFTVSVREAEDYSSGWQHVRFGQSASTKLNSLTMDDANYGTIGEDVSLILTTTGGGGKVADGHDGINYYYRVLNPEDNFVLTVDVEVISFSNLDTSVSIYGQEAFGVMLRDRIAEDGDTSSWNSSMFMVGARGSEQWRALYRDNRLNYIDGITATNTVIPLEGNTMSNFSRSGGTDASKATITFVRSNNQFSGSITVDGVTNTFSFDNDIPLDYYDEDYIYVGFFTARNADIRFSNASLTVTDANSDPEGPEIKQEAITPTLSVHSASESADTDYTLIYSSNVSGTANVYYNSTLIESAEVTAYTLMKSSYTIGAGSNAFIVEFVPDADGYYSSYDKVLISKTVALLEGMDTIYVSPNGTGNGSAQSPMAFANAVRYLKAGGTIILTEGDYGALTIPMFINGEDGAYKNVAAEGAVTTGNLVISGDFWHVKGFTVANANVRIGGNDNIIELLTVYGSANTGVQISRTGSAELFYNVETWPSRNIILNCESYNHQDAANNDADGFAAKLTVGEGNMFIGCVAHHNVDDGWDLYAKGVPIGAVALESCIAFHNGHVLGSTTQFGDGNGFKLGGEGVAVQHSIRNSIAFENNADGYTSNSNPTLIAENNVSFDNGGANISFSSYSNVSVRDYQMTNFYSYRKNVFSDSKDTIEAMDETGTVYAYTAQDVYLCDKNGVSSNSLGRIVTDAFFVSVEAPTEHSSQEEKLYNYQRDSSITNEAGGSYVSNIVFGDFLALTELAYNHTESEQGKGSTDVITTDVDTVKPQQQFEDNETSTSGYTVESESGIILGFKSGYVQGFTDGTVRPDSMVTRGEAVTMLYRLVLNPEHAGELELSFSDLSTDYYYYEAAQYFAAHGIINGLPDGSFAGEQTLTRAELAKILSFFVPAQTEQSMSFSDISSHWAQEYVLILASNGIIKGYADGSFRPDYEITRAELIVLINRLLEVDTEQAENSSVSFSDLAETHWAYADIKAATSIEEDNE